MIAGGVEAAPVKSISSAMAPHADYVDVDRALVPVEVVACWQAGPFLLDQGDAGPTSRLFPGRPGAEVIEAHRRLEAGRLNGKLVLCPDLPSRRDQVAADVGLVANPTGS